MACRDRTSAGTCSRPSLGAWPITADRLSAHLEKAFREAKVHTTWIAPDEEWERRTQGYARAVLDLPGFLDDFVPLAERVARAGEVASIGQTLLRVTAPGVPDTYQGDEELFLALVDPDNRRPLDWALRRSLLALIKAGAAPNRETRKLWLIERLLALRARHPEAFAGGYEPLDAADGVCAYVRGGDVLVAVAVRAGAPARGTCVAPGLAGRAGRSPRRPGSAGAGRPVGCQARNHADPAHLMGVPAGRGRGTRSARAKAVRAARGRRRGGPRTHPAGAATCPPRRTATA